MKLLTKAIAVVGLLVAMSGCSSTSQGTLDGMNGGVCNNPKCKCPKPCQCGAGCKCGMNGNSDSLNGAPAK